MPSLPDLATLAPVAATQLEEKHLAAEVALEGEESDEALAMAFGELGMVYHAYRDFGRARDLYQAAHRLSPEEFRWPYYLGHLEVNDGRFDDAAAVLAVALGLRPDYVPALVWKGEAEFGRGRLDDARVQFERAVDRRPTCVQALVRLARLDLDDSSADAAIARLEPALALQPNATEVRFLLGSAYRALGETARAAQYFDGLDVTGRGRVPVRFDDPLLQEVSNLRKTAQVMARQAQDALDQKRFQEAEDLFQQALTIDPDRPDLRYNLAALWVRRGRRDDGLEQLDELLRRTPDHALGRTLRARILTNMGEFEAAEADLRATLAADSESAVAHVALAELLRRRQAADEALKHYRRALTLAPQRVDAQVGVVMVLMSRGDAETVEDQAREFLNGRSRPRTVSLLLSRELALSDGPAKRAEANRLLERFRDGSVFWLESAALSAAVDGRWSEAESIQQEALDILEARPRHACSEEIVQERLARYADRRLPARAWEANEVLCNAQAPK